LWRTTHDKFDTIYLYALNLQVDLGIEAKIMNIERTEKAKRKLLEEAKRSGAKTADRDAANPSNMYVQHDRYRIC
jgi:Hepatocellular carcinoma-associated antigen 59